MNFCAPEGTRTLNPQSKNLLRLSSCATRALPEHYDWLNLLPITNLAPILALVMVKRANITAYIFV